MFTNTYSFTSLSRMLLTAIGAFVFVMFFTASTAGAQSFDSGLEGGSNDRSFSIGDWVETTDVLKVRNGLGVLLGTQPAFALGRVISGPRTAQGYTYWEVNFDSGFDGWSAAPWLRLSSDSGTQTNDEDGFSDRNDLIALINSLLAQIASLQSGGGGGGGGGPQSNEGEYTVLSETSSLDRGVFDQQIATVAIEDSREIRYINKVDVEFINEDGSSEVQDSFTEISVWIDGNKVYSIDTDDVQWRDDGIDMRTRQKGTIFDSDDFGSGIPVPANTDIDAVIGLSVASDAVAEDWTFLIANRGVDMWSPSLGNFVLGDNDTDSVSFAIQGEGDDSLQIRTSSFDPDATTFQIENGNVSKEHLVFAFELGAEDSQEDIEIELIDFDFDIYNTKDGFDLTDLIDDAVIRFDGGETNDDFTFTRRNQILTFDDLDIYIDEGDSVTVELFISFEPAESTEGAEFDVSVEQVLGEGDDDVVAEGSASGGRHALRSEGIITYIISVDEESIENSDVTSSDDEGKFTIEFDVTAFESDIYINPTTRRDGGGSQGTEGFTYNLRDGAKGLDYFTGNAIASVVSTADQERSGRYRIDEGETEGFELVVRYTPEESDFYQMQLFSINYNTVDANPNQYVRPNDSEDFETDFLQIYGEADGGVNPLLGCEIVTDKQSYLFGDRIRVSWKGVNAQTMQFVADNSGKDNIRVPSGTQRTSGSAILAANLYGNPTVTMRATAANGDTSDCTVRFQIVQKEEEPTQTTRGIYKVYIDGQLAVTARDTTREYATNSCKSGEKDPTKSYRCTWNGIEVYKSDAAEVETSSKPRSDSSLPALSRAAYKCSADGTKMTFSWSAPRGTDTFYFRFQDEDGNRSNWENSYERTSKTVTVVPGQEYTWWAHAKDTSNGNWGPTLRQAGVSCDEPEIEETTEAPERNAYACDRSSSRKISNGKSACYGMWDYGNSFGGDKAMCGSYGAGKTGCEINVPVCSSGKAKAVTYYSNSQLSRLSTSLISNIADNLDTTTGVVKEEVAGMWEYQCVADEVEETKPVAKAQSDASLPKPAQPTHICRNDGTRLIMRWDAPNGYENFYFRMHESESKERMNWVSKHPNTSRRVDVEPGVKYDWWVHTRDDVMGNWSGRVGEYGIACEGSVLGASISQDEVRLEIADRLGEIKDRLEVLFR